MENFVTMNCEFSLSHLVSIDLQMVSIIILLFSWVIIFGMTWWLQGELANAREVFDAFFKFYPFCYGYWKKLADLEKTHAGNDSAKEVSQLQMQAFLSRGRGGIP